MEHAFEKKMERYVEINRTLAPSTAVLEAVEKMGQGAEPVKHRDKTGKKTLVLVLVAVGALATGAVAIGRNNKTTLEDAEAKYEYWREHSDIYTSKGGVRLDCAEPYRSYLPDGSYVERDLGGYYNERGEYILPAEVGYWVLVENGEYNPVTGEYFWVTVNNTGQ